MLMLALLIQTSKMLTRDTIDKKGKKTKIKTTLTILNDSREINQESCTDVIPHQEVTTLNLTFSTCVSRRTKSNFWRLCVWFSLSTTFSSRKRKFHHPFLQLSSTYR